VGVFVFFTWNRINYLTHEDVDYTEYLGTNDQVPLGASIGRRRKLAAEGRHAEQEEDENCNPALYVCNHHGFLEVVTMHILLHPSFVAKYEISREPFIGAMAKALQCIFVHRTNQDQKNTILESIERRQIEIEDKRLPYTPITIFPEGTTTHGKHLIPFKRGAFESMRTCVPCVHKFSYCHHSPTWETISVPDCIIMWLCHPGFCLSTLEMLPPFVPNQYMLDTHADKGASEWEIYAWCIRDIMRKRGNYELSDVSHREKLEYEKWLRK